MKVAELLLWILTLLGLCRATPAQNCRNNEMYCPGNGQFIPTRQMCNGREDCPTGEDEAEAYCDKRCPGEFRCAIDACIPTSWVCEATHVPDCENGKDEDAVLCCGMSSSSSGFPANVSTTAMTIMSDEPSSDSRRKTSTQTIPSEEVTIPSEEVRCQPVHVLVDQQRTVVLPLAPLGTSVELPCFSTGFPLLKATCVYSLLNMSLATYDIEVLNANCSDKVSASSQRLGYLSMEPITEDNILDIVTELGNLTGPSIAIQPADINLVSLILQKIAESVGAVGSADKLLKVSSSTGTIVSNVMAVNDTTLQEAAANVTLLSRIIGSFDEILLKTSESLAKAGKVELHLVATANLAYQVATDPLVAGLGLCRLDNDTLLPVTLFHGGAQGVALPSVASCSNNPQAEIMLTPAAQGLPKTFAMYSNSRLFRGSKYRAVAGAAVLSSQIAKEEPHRLTSSGNDLVLLKQKIDQIAIENGYAIVCGYWNFTLGDWATDGCITEEATLPEVTCSCDHLTNFAVLFVPKLQGDSIHDTILSYVSTISLSISSFALVFVLITSLICRKLRKSDLKRLTACLSASLLCMNLLFIFGISATGSGTCSSVAVTLHYFLLTSFMYMGAEAVLHYLRLVKVLGTHVSYFIWKVSAVSLGVPALAVICIRFGQPSLYENEGQYCWVQPPLQIYGVMVPIGMIIVINSIIFMLIVRALKCGHKLRSSMPDHRMASLQAKALVSAFIVLGITWVFGYLATIGHVSVVFQYLFSICNSLQGLLIFIFHIMKAPFIARWFRSALTSTSKCKGCIGIARTDREARSTRVLSLTTTTTTSTTSGQVGWPTSSTSVTVLLPGPMVLASSHSNQSC